MRSTLEFPIAIRVPRFADIRKIRHLDDIAIEANFTRFRRYKRNVVFTIRLGHAKGVIFAILLDGNCQ